MRRERLEYLENPNLCKNCREPILPIKWGKLRDTRKKIFCDLSCAGKHSSKNRLSYRKTPKARHCPQCGARYEHEKTGRGHRKYCSACLESRKITRRKNELERIGRTPKAETTRDYICYNARNRVRRDGRTRACIICGYQKFVQTCHVRQVKDFPPEATIDEINALTNLVLLCPNHHKELDHGNLQLIDPALNPTLF